MIKIRRAAERGHFNHGWLDTYHTFSFGDYFDPQHTDGTSLQVRFSLSFSLRRFSFDKLCLDVVDRFRGRRTVAQPRRRPRTNRRFLDHVRLG